MPPRTGKCLTRSVTSTSGAVACRGGCRPPRPAASERPSCAVPASGRRWPLPCGVRAVRRARHGASGRPPRRDRASSARRGPSPTGRSRGWTSVAIATSSSIWVAQRGANRQPLGRSMRLGTLPGMTASSSLTAPTTGMEPIRPCVYGWCGWRKSDATSVCSTISPAYMTATRSHISATTPEVVGDEDDRRPGLVAQVAHQVEDLGLDRDVERGRRLVGDEQLGLAGEGHRDHHALGHAAGHLVREVLEAPRRVGDADHLEELLGARLRRPCPSSRGGCAAPPRSGRPTSHTGFSDDVGCWKIMLIRSPRILRIASSEELEQVLAVEQDLAVLDPARASRSAA